MSNSIFAKIIAGEIPSHKVYEDSHTLAFLDINPIAKGHTLVIPKVEAATLMDINEQMLGDLFVAVQRTMHRLEEVLHPDGFNVGWNHGKAGGQAIDYLHVHIVPRWKEDGGGNIHTIINNAGDMSVEEVAALFAK